MADFDYSYAGDAVGILTMQSLPDGAATVLNAPLQLQSGNHHRSVEVQHPRTVEHTTGFVIRMKWRGAEIASQEIAHEIHWPEYYDWVRARALAGKSVEERVSIAVALIDEGKPSALAEAKLILEGVVQQDARFHPAYIELARVAMKTNWGQEGLHQAERLLDSALQIDPASVNAKILIGYVYAHQQRFAKAEAMFTAAALTEPRNLWLWANWGEALAMQGKLDLAAKKYAETLTRPRTNDTYDRARLGAYEQLLSLHARRKDVDSMEALHKQRVAEFGAGSCYGVEYAKFVLQLRGDSARAMEMARTALEARCSNTDARQVVGLAHYVTWANTTGQERQDALNQARIFLPAGPMPLYLLASSQRTNAAASKLIAAGENIDQKDNDNWTALAYALHRNDVDTARRLLRLGARPETPVGYDDMPTALLPVVERNLEIIRLMQEFGANYAKLEHEGMTAFDAAKLSGDEALLEALQKKAPVL